MATPLPDTPIEPVTLARLEEILVMEGIEFATDDNVLRTGLGNCAIAVTIDGDYLICDSLWRGEMPGQRGAELIVVANQWNSTRPGPVLRILERGGGILMASAYRRQRITEGLSRNQLGAFLMSSIEAIGVACGHLDQTFPELVTWRYTP